MKHSCVPARIVRARTLVTHLLVAQVFVALSLVSCGFNPLVEETVTVELPPSIPIIDLLAPGADLRWTVSWLDDEGTRHESAHERGSVDITLNRGTFTPILATPETAAFGIPDSFLPRAGTVYPDAYDEKQNALVADWTGGVCADIARKVILDARGGVDAGRTLARHFNWRRLARTLAETDEPGKVDRARLADAILSLDMTKRDVTAGKLANLRPETVAAALAMTSRVGDTGALATTARDTTAAAPDGATFLPEWPVTGAVKPTEETVRVASGVTRFFSASGYLTVIASDGAVRSCFFSRYGLQD